MTYKNIKKKTEGFTIIEVLIVLAIAGLIMIIVFLAVPALQRNSRNTQREADASKVASAISQCLANRNGQVASCQSLNNVQTNGGLEADRLQQITTVNIGSAAPNDPANFETINAGFGVKCDDAGAADEQSGSTRTAAVLYRSENGTATGIVRCIDV